MTNFEKSTPEQQREQEVTINSTAEFRGALDKGNLQAAEAWLRQAAGTKEGYNDRWTDHRE